MWPGLAAEDTFLNPAGCCRQPYFILMVQGASVFLLAAASHVPCQLADRAFGAQRFSDGRAGRRFAPPSAAGNALKTGLRRLKAGPRGLKPGLQDWTTGPLGLTTGLRGLRAKSAKPGFQSLKPSFKTPKPSLQSPKPSHQICKPRPQMPQMGPKVTPGRTCAWGTRFSQASAQKVVGLRRFNPKTPKPGKRAQRRGPAEGGRGEVSLPL